MFMVNVYQEWVLAVQVMMSVQQMQSAIHAVTLLVTVFRVTRRKESLAWILTSVVRGSVRVEITLYATTMLGVSTAPVLRGSQVIHPGQLALMIKLLHGSWNKVAPLYYYCLVIIIYLIPSCYV